MKKMEPSRAKVAHPRSIMQLVRDATAWIIWSAAHLCYLLPLVDSGMCCWPRSPFLHSNRMISCRYPPCLHGLYALCLLCPRPKPTRQGPFFRLQPERGRVEKVTSTGTLSDCLVLPNSPWVNSLLIVSLLSVQFLLTSSWMYPI